MPHLAFRQCPRPTLVIFHGVDVHYLPSCSLTSFPDGSGWPAAAVTGNRQANRKRYGSVMYRRNFH